MNKEELIAKHSITPETSILKAVKKMDELNSKLLMVLADGKFESLLSIGDIQRGIIKGTDLENPVSEILRDRKKIRVATTEDSQETIQKSILDFRMEFMPVVDEYKNVADIIFWENVFKGRERITKSNLNVPVVVMAGGQGTRLKPITNIIPKALVPIDEKPIVELIIDKFARMGARNFYMTVNYKAKMLEGHFNELDKNYEVSFVHEDKPLGTAGSLSLLRDKINETFFVTNCDILIDDDYEQVYRYHKKEGNELTIVAALKHYSIPYGILETGDNGKLTAIKEKPEMTYQVNSGMYILEPHLLADVPDDEFFHITHLIEKILERGGKVGVFPVSERSWMDIGEWSEYNKTRDILAKNGMRFS